MIVSLALLCCSVVLGIVGSSYTYRAPVRNLYASVDCVNAEVTAAVRFLAFVGAAVCGIAAARGFL